MDTRAKLNRTDVSYGLCLLAGLTLACGKGGKHAAQAADAPAPKVAESTLLVAVEEGPNSLDIHGVGTNRPSYGASWNVYDRLITFGRKTLPDGQVMYDFEKLEPELAAGWEVDRGKSITFQLRADATFHDGTKVTAHDVKWSFDRAVTIGGFPPFQMKAGSLEKPEQFEVVDDATFRIKLLRADTLTLPDLGVPVPALYNAKLAKQPTFASSTDSEVAVTLSRS